MLEYPASMKGLLVVELDFSVCHLLHAVLRAGVLWLPGTCFQRAPAAVKMKKHCLGLGTLPKDSGKARASPG